MCLNILGTDLGRVLHVWEGNFLSLTPKATQFCVQESNMFTFVNLGNVGRPQVVKFVVVESTSELLVGSCFEHKELVLSRHGDCGQNVLAAGIAPKRPELAPISDLLCWGNWSSQHYNCRTPLVLREEIRSIFLNHKEELLILWSECSL